MPRADCACCAGRDDLEDLRAEVTPLAGTMVAFRRSERSFHGHRPHVGERRSLQLNWVMDEAVVRRELSRHRWSARLKALNPFGSRLTFSLRVRFEAHRAAKQSTRQLCRPD